MLIIMQTLTSEQESSSHVTQTWFFSNIFNKKGKFDKNKLSSCQAVVESTNRRKAIHAKTEDATPTATRIGAPQSGVT